MKKHALIFCSLFTATMLIAEQAAAKTTMFDEARMGKIEELRKRLDNDEDCSQTEESTGDTVLHIAAENGHTDVVDLLTTKQDRSGFLNWFYYLAYNPVKLPDKDKQNKDGNTAVHLSIAAGKSDATDVLLKKGVRTDICNKQDYPPAFMILDKNNIFLIPLLSRCHCLEQKVNGNNILHVAIKKNKPLMAAWLIDEGLFIDEKDGEGKTIAGLAATYGNVDVLQRLIAKNVNLNESDKHGARPIHYASLYGQYNVLTYLSANNVSHEVTDNQGNTPWHYAAKSGNAKAIDFFFAHKANMQQRNNDGEDIFLVAVAQKRWSLVRELAQKPGIDINSRDNQGKTALMRAIDADDYDGMQQLCNLSVNVGITDNHQENALHKVSRWKDKNGVEFILSKNRTLLETKNKNGETPLFVSVSKGYEKTTNALLQAKASLMVTDKQGNTIIHVAAGQSNTGILATILQQGGKPNIDALNQAGLSALHCAAQANNIAGIKILEQYGAAFNIVTAQGNNLAHAAIEKDATDALKYIIAHNPILLESVNKHNEMPLVFACRMGASNCLPQLLRDKDFIDRNVEFGLSVANQHGQYNISNFLQTKIKERRNFCKKIHAKYKTVKSLIEDNNNKVGQLMQKDLLYIITWGTYNPSQPNYYTEDQLYYMTEADRTKIYNYYLECENKEQKINTDFSNELNKLILQEAVALSQAQAAQQERERIARAEQERREREIRRQIEENNAKQQRILEEQKQREFELAQQRDLEYYKQKKENEDAAIAAQKAEENRIAQARMVEQQKQAAAAAAAQKKALADAQAAHQQKHQRALEEQQPHAHMDLQPSAPLIEDATTAAGQCQCGGKTPAKPLPCVKCKKKCTGICAQCIKTHAGRCPQCFELYNLGIEKRKGECFICKEEDQEVTTSPCSTCINRKDYICKECLRDCLQHNESANLGNKCPLCTEKTLKKELAEKIISQQR